MRPRRRRKFKESLLVAIIIIAGFVAGYLGYDQKRESLREDALDEARHSSVVFASTELNQLTGQPADLSTAAYASVRARMRRFQEADSKVRSLRIFRYFPTENRTITLADASAERDAGHLAPGDPFPSQALSADLDNVARAGQAILIGPHRERGEVVTTGYSVIEASAASSTAPRDFLAIDVVVRHWTRDLILAAASTAVLMWLILGLPYVVYVLARRELEQGEAIRNLSEAIEQSRGAVMVVDLNGNVEYANRGFCEQIGCKRRELIGQSWKDFLATESAPKDSQDLVSAVREGRAWSGEWSHRRQDGSVYPVRGAFTPVHKKNGKLSCFIATFEDMTAQKETEAMLRDSKERAEAGETAKSQFLATMSHEVRTPLNGIIGFTSLLLDTPLTPEQREFVQTIQLSSEALIQLTGDILDFARIESGKLNLEPQPCSVRECVEDALDLSATKAAAKGIVLLHWIEDSVPDTIYADGNRLRQVLINLVTNAVKFTERGEVEVRVRSERRTAPGSRPVSKLVFSVRDTGIGVPRDQQDRLFKPFTQLDQELTRRHGGTGLGLAISKNIVELMRGEFFLKSEPGHGSTFSFTIEVEANPVVAEHKAFVPLETLRLAIAAPEGSFRDELMRLGRRFGATLVETTPAQLGATPGWDVALLDLDSARISELVAETKPAPELPPERMFGLVPLSLPSGTRAALRIHFRLLVNKPLHHGALYSLLAAAVQTPVLAKTRQTAGLRVLLVEDEPVNRLLMQKQLTTLGCNWAKAENGRAAIEELNKKTYDFVLMDLYMPEMDGVSAIKHIREGLAGETSKHVWISVLTADARNDQKDRAIEVGANDYLVKPVNMPELRVALEKSVIARRTTTRRT